MASIYYLAAGDEEALQFVGEPQEPLTIAHVLAHDMITVPHLTSLADLAEGLPLAIDISVATNIWPVMPADPASDAAWMDEPIIERIADRLRDRIAAIHPDTLKVVIQNWTTEVSGAVDEGLSEQLALDLIDLCREGRDRQLALYNRYDL